MSLARVDVGAALCPTLLSGARLSAALLSTALLLSACQGEVEIGRLSVAPFKCQDGLTPGPSNLEWCTFAAPETEAQVPSTASSWIGLTPRNAHVLASSPQQSSAGMIAAFDTSWRVKHVGDYGALEFQANIPAGTSFEVFVGAGPDAGCYYPVRGRGQETYKVNLRNPYWCRPTFCGYDLQASGIAFSTNVGDGSAIDIDLTSLTLTRSKNFPPAGTVLAQGAVKGPNDLCFFPFGWGNGNSSDWDKSEGLPSARSVKVHAEGPKGQVVGMAFELPGPPFKIGEKNTMTLTGNVPAGMPFMVQLVNGGRGATWRFTGREVAQSDTSAYTIDLRSQPDSWFSYDATVFEIPKAQRVEISKPYETKSTLDATITDVQFSP